MNRLWLLASIALPLACGKETPPDVIVPPAERFESTAEADGSFTVKIDASGLEEWIYVDLETNKEVTVDAPATSPTWDLAFQRFKVKLNGGDSGGQDVEAAMVEGTAFEALVTAPGAGYERDAPDGDDDGTIPDYAVSFGPSSETGPWAYNVETHELSDSNAIWVVRSVEGNLYKFAFLDYYDAAGSPGHLTIHWKALTGSLPNGVLEVTFPMTGFANIDLEAGPVDITDPLTSVEWDLGVKGPGWQTNSGDGRVGLGGARLAPDGTNFDAVTSAPTSGYVVDTMIVYPGPPGSPRYLGNALLNGWYDYDSINHLATPKDVVYFIRRASGDYGKLKIVAYDEVARKYQLKLGTLTRAADTVSASVDASDIGAWVYYSLREATVVEPRSAATETTWDLGFSRTRIRTNGGTSGRSQGGANAGVTGALDAISVAPSSGYNVDVMLPDRESPGDQFSGNPLLADWYEVTGTSTSPKDLTFVIRAADGTFAKMKIDGYADGRYTFDYVYAGPGTTSF